ncbi:uncharacterized protein LOC129950827 [Eupeodes corollae]|uniref:uncharacterized protein LOC129950827 n=1 Tax=Eupeodes corollae TaxID=290404 RepID=UPI0024908407|nr:uncharacterized protein LOC129950827 [Eupeodes corollae]
MPQNLAVPLLDNQITVNELNEFLQNTKRNKSPGLDRVPYEFLTKAPQSAINILAKLSNRMLECGKVESDFQKSIIFSNYKKGDQNIVQNYRGISFMDTIGKSFAGVLLTRLQQWEKEFSILNEFQAGFREGYSTADNPFNLFNIIKLQMNDNKKVYCSFIDFKAAFDYIDRRTLLYKLQILGISEKLIPIIRDLYDKRKAAVCDGEQLSD